MVGEDELAGVGCEQAAGCGSDFERNTAGIRVGSEDFAVGAVLWKDDLGADVTADRPKIDGGVALVRDDCATYGEDRGGEGSKSKGY